MKMKSHSWKFYLVLAVDTMALASLIFFATHTLSYPGADFRYTFENGRVIVTGFPDTPPLMGSLQIGDTLITNVDNHLDINYPDVFNFGTRFINYHFAGIREIGDTIHLEVKRGNIKLIVPYILPQQNKPRDVIPAWISGFFFIVIGFFTYFKKREDPSALLFHWTTIAVAFTTSLLLTEVDIWKNIFAYIPHFILVINRTILYSLILHFSLIFPRKKIRRMNWILWSIYLFSTTYAIFQNMGGYAWSHLGPSSIEFKMWRSYDPIFGWIALLFFVLAFFSFIHSYYTAEDQAARKKMLWAISGISISLIFSIVGQIFTLVFGLGQNPIPSWVYSIAYSTTPICFAIAIIRYQLFNIDTIINRSVVYVGVIGFLALVYEGIVHVVALILHGTFTRDESVVTSTLATAVVALLFEPAKEKTQHLIDKKFYRTKYNYRQASVAIGDGISNAGDVQEIASIIVEELDKLIQVERIGFYSVEQPGNKIVLLVHHHCDLLQGHEVTLDLHRLQSGEHLPLGAEDLVEADAKVKRLPSVRFHEWGLSLIIPLFSERKEVQGFIVLGAKKSQMKFTLEDVDLLRGVASQSELAIERLQHQELIRMRHDEEERRKELQKMKIVTGTGIPHELDVLIENGAYYKKIEQGTLQLTFEPCKPNDLVTNALKSLSFPIAMEHCEVQADLTANNVLINCDKKSIEQVLRTLLSNAMRYGGVRKYIKIETGVIGSEVVISIQDKGIGIGEEEQIAIFEPFFRGSGKDVSASGGSGLGLAVAKFIVLAHKGQISVKSILGEGSTFIIRIPLIS